MEQIRPSDGKRTKVSPINLNFYGYKAGEHVLYQGFGGWAEGVIDQVNGNTVVIGHNYIDVRTIRARVPAGADAAAVVRDLASSARLQTIAVAAAQRAYADSVEAILAKHGVKHPGDE